MPKNLTRQTLVIEDDRDISHLGELHLQDMGCDVTLAHDGLAGLEKGMSASRKKSMMSKMMHMSSSKRKMEVHKMMKMDGMM